MVAFYAARERSPSSNNWAIRQNAGPAEASGHEDRMPACPCHGGLVGGRDGNEASPQTGEWQTGVAGESSLLVVDDDGQE